MVRGLFIMNVCVTGSVIWSAMPATTVEATETLPSSGPSISAENTGFSE